MRLTIEVDGQPLAAEAGQTILQTLREHGNAVPTLCQHDNLKPANACRLCVVELAGARTLAPACSRQVEEGMRIQTDSPRVRRARKVVCELLASSTDTATAPALQSYMARYGAEPARFGEGVATVREPVRLDNALYMRDYDKCILCYKCVEACGDGAQSTFALSVAGRGFDARIDTGADTPLLNSRCVFCGNCVAVCPTGALMPVPEHEMRAAGTWDESRQTVTSTICAYCGVGCQLDLHVQDNHIVKVTSPADHSVTHGNLCVKGRFGFTYIHPDLPDLTADTPSPQTPSPARRM
jgi:predicted molibdopterin-dependent oxidoreductase YjgC